MIKVFFPFIVFCHLFDMIFNYIFLLSKELSKYSRKWGTSKTSNFDNQSIYSVCVLTSTRHDIKVYPHLQANKTNCGVYIQSIDI